MTRGRAAGLTDRRSERDALDRLVEAIRSGQSQALVVRGDPGVGKTVLLDYLAGRARGCRVARAVGVQTEIELAFAGREDQPDRVGGQPPGHEPQRLRRRLVQPLLVVDQADQRSFPGHLREQAQHGQPDQEPVRRRPGGQAERDPQRILLRHRQVPGAAQHRRAQLMQAREGQLHLRLHARRARHPAPARLPGHIVQQHRLAHARVAAHHQRPALATPDRIDEPAQRVAFAAPVRQPGHASPGH